MQAKQMCVITSEQSKDLARPARAATASQPESQRVSRFQNFLLPATVDQSQNQSYHALVAVSLGWIPHKKQRKRT